MLDLTHVLGVQQKPFLLANLQQKPSVSARTFKKSSPLFLSQKTLSFFAMKQL